MVSLSRATKFPPKTLKTLILSLFSNPSSTSPRSLSTSTETQTQKLERIADELLDLTKLERHDYAILFRLKLGLNNYGPAVSGLGSASGSGQADSKGSAATAAAEKTVFDIKLEKFDAAAKIKVIKEVRTFTDLGLKEAKDLVEKAPAVLKKGVSKEEGNAIIEKLKELGATAVLE
ncbi:Ribosomal protein L7/L12, C-terminal [Dillenia turbinata]|uniref:Ribosomal protein L7/L12, C-terminal n=1 Tax=Dillenia turbinata TaxID=194707 RepID=A0AAN8Z1I7_9MAGN